MPPLFSCFWFCFFFYLFYFIRYNTYCPPPYFLHCDCILGISASTQNILILFLTASQWCRISYLTYISWTNWTQSSQPFVTADSAISDEEHITRGVTVYYTRQRPRVRLQGKGGDAFSVFLDLPSPHATPSAFQRRSKSLAISPQRPGLGWPQAFITQRGEWRNCILGELQFAFWR